MSLSQHGLHSQSAPSPRRPVRAGRSVGEGGQERGREAGPVDNCKRYPQAWRGHCRLQRRGRHGDLMASDSPEYPRSSPHASSWAAAPAVLSRLAALDVLSPAQLRWRVGTGRWQRPCPGVLVTHSGPLTADDALWVSLVWAGDGAVLAGLTAAHLDGLAGFPDDRIHVLVPDSRQVRKPPPGISVFLHRSRRLGPDDVHPAKSPPRTRIARSLVDAAAWMRTDRGTQAVLAAGVQQRLVRPADLLAVVAGNPRLPVGQSFSARSTTSWRRGGPFRDRLHPPGDPRLRPARTHQAVGAV